MPPLPLESIPKSWVGSVSLTDFMKSAIYQSFIWAQVEGSVGVGREGGEGEVLGRGGV